MAVAPHGAAVPTDMRMLAALSAGEAETRFRSLMFSLSPGRT